MHRVCLLVAVLVSCTQGAGSPPAVDRPSGPTPTRSPSPEPTLTIVGVGDIMMARRVGGAMRATGDFGYPFEHVSRMLGRADLSFGNLESTLARLGPATQGDAFAADPRSLRGVVSAGIDLVSLANNHVGDFGPRSLLATVDELNRAGIRHVGAGARASRARRPAILRARGLSVGFLAFNAIGETPAPGPDRPGAVRIAMQPRLGPLRTADLARFLADVRDLDAMVDIVIVLPHWGAQYTFDVHPEQRRVARALVRAGADAVIGGHSHWVGGIESHRGVPIVYSLGNFVFDMDIDRRTQEAIAIELRFEGPDLASIRPIPIVIGDDWAPRRARAARAERILADVERASAALNS